MSNSIERVLRAGEKVTVVEHQGNWSRVRTSRGEDLWVYSSYLATSKRKSATPTFDGRLTGQLGADDLSGSMKGASIDGQTHVTATIDAPFGGTLQDGKPVLDPTKTRGRIPVTI